MDNRSESERYQEWIKHPVTQDMLRRIDKVADDLVKEYDNCTEAELRRIQVARRLIKVDLPRMIDKSINPPEREKKWDWRQLLGL